MKQECGLGQDVSILRRSRDVITSRLGLGLVSDKIFKVSISDWCVSGLVSEQYVSVSAQ